MSINLVDQLEKLKRAYYSGSLKVKFDEKEVTYRSLNEMRAIISDLEREIEGSNNPNSSYISFIADKGL
jgi:hypothetical protein